MSILCCPHLCRQFNDYANELLHRYVEDVHKIYGVEMLVYNVHNLIHLADDAKLFGCLDNFSAFRFENKLKGIKRMVRKPQFPLAQLDRRVREANRLQTNKVEHSKQFITSKPHDKGPIIGQFVNSDTIIRQYQQVKNKEMCLSIINRCDNTIINDRNRPATVRNIVDVDGVIWIIYEEFKNVSNFFDYPLNSSEMGIFMVHQHTGNLEFMQLDRLKSKCLCLPSQLHRNEFVIFPLLHHELV